MATVYCVALVAAGALGVTLGQRQHAQSSNVEGIVNQVAVEALALSEGDSTLYSSTLDPEAPDQVRSAFLEQFLRSAPRNRDFAVVNVSFVASDRAHVTVRVGSPGGASSASAAAGDLEQREYRRMGDSWLRSR